MDASVLASKRLHEREFCLRNKAGQRANDNGQCRYEALFIKQCGWFWRFAQNIYALSIPSTFFHTDLNSTVALVCVLQHVCAVIYEDCELFLLGRVEVFLHDLVHHRVMH